MNTSSMITTRLFDQIPKENIENVMKLFNEYYSIRSSFNGTIVDSSSIISTLHIETGCAHSIVKYNSKRMKTKSLWDEIQYSLSGTCRIDEAINIFKVTTTSNCLSIITIDKNILNNGNDQIIDDTITTQQETFLNNVIDALKDYEVSLDEFNVNKTERLRNNKEYMENIMKSYKVNTLEIEACGLENAIISRIAVKDVL